MRYVAAAMLVNMAGIVNISLSSVNDPIVGNDVSIENIKKVLDSVGVEADKEKMKLIVASLKGKDIEELIVEGQAKLGTVPSGGAVVAAAGAVTASAEPADAEKKEEKKEEPEDESDDDMGFGLFD